MRLESDTSSQLSHRAALYIDPYYQGQIAKARAVCLGTLVGKEKANTELDAQPIHRPLNHLDMRSHSTLRVR